MHILVTDSGVGGLSVFALLERFLRLHPVQKHIRITYANASPEDEYGYNSMPTRDEKIITFDRFLKNVTEKYQPDFIYIACNTLSVLYKDTAYSKAEPVPVLDIVTTGIRFLLEKLRQDPTSVAMLFATVTTIEEAVIQAALLENGIAPGRIVRQACPSLADTISDDFEGHRIRKKIKTYASQALQQIEYKGIPFLVYLGCTHYGYRKSFFLDELRSVGCQAEIINPNEGAVSVMMEALSERITSFDEEASLSIEVVSRYRIPDRTLKVLAYYLEHISQETVKSIQQFTYCPGLF